MLREAAYRRIGSGPEPVPAQLSDLQSVNEDLDGLLVCADGLLLDIVEKSSETHLMVQAKGLIFEAQLNRLQKQATRQKLELGSKLAVTGVYRIQRDESGKPRSFFLLNLFVMAAMFASFQPPPWWTPRRLWLVLIAGV